MSSQKKIISVVIPCLNQENQILSIYYKIKEIWQNDLVNYQYELIFADSGSQDKTADKIRELIETDDSVRFLELSRDFGKEAAILAGIINSEGDACLTIGLDFQDSAKYILDFVKKWEEGFEVVAALEQVQTKTSKLKQKIITFKNELISAFSEVNVLPGALDYRLLDKKVVAYFKRFTKKGRVTKNLVDWIGFKQGLVYCRLTAKKRSLLEKLKQAKIETSLIVANSVAPLKFASYLGLFITFTTGLTGFLALINQLVLKTPESYWVFSGPFLLALLNSFLVGITLICLGLISLYILNIYVEVDNKPLYIIRNKKGFDNN